MLSLGIGLTSVPVLARRGELSGLAKLYVSSLPIGGVEIPSSFNNTLGSVISWGGSRIDYGVNPYTAIDFTLTEACNHYYVDYALGANANAGTSAGSGNAWKTFDYARANAVSPAVIHLKDDWVGYLSAGATNGVVFSGKFKIIGEGPSGRTRFVGMRESYNADFYGFVVSGSGGAYKTTALTSNSDFYRAQFDRKYRDAKGFPRPIVAAASQAACEGTPGTYFWDLAGLTLYVHMMDGRKPDPADGWMYARSAYRAEWQQALDTAEGVLLGENLEFCYNTGSAQNAAFRIRPQTIGATSAARFGLKNCLSYGSSGNGFEIYDADVTVMENCHARYCKVDGLNYHSFVTTGTKGEFITVYEHDCSAFDTGYDGFADQGAVSVSSNGTTSHDSMHVLRTNGVYGDCNGAVVADVNGVHSLNYNVQASHPKGTASPRACFWHDKYLSAGTTRTMLLWGCAAFDGGDPSVSLLDNTAQGGGQVGDIRVGYWRGQVSGKVVGPVQDFAGNTV